MRVLQSHDYVRLSEMQVLMISAPVLAGSMQPNLGADDYPDGIECKHKGFQPHVTRDSFNACYGLSFDSKFDECLLYYHLKKR